MYSIRKYRAEDFHPVLDFYNKYGTVRHVTERMWKRLVLLAMLQNLLIICF